MDNITEFKKSLKALMLKYNMSLGVNIEGDTHGINTNFCIYEGNCFIKPLILAECQDYLEACDIEV